MAAIQCFDDRAMPDVHRLRRDREREPLVATSYYLHTWYPIVTATSTAPP
jgi:hypothetical protein